MKPTRFSQSNPSRRGASGCWKAAGITVLILLLAGGCIAKTAVDKYNGIVTSQENVDSKWSDIHNQYQRRMEMVPQLVATVKGAANFEKSTLQAVTDARASVGKMQMPSKLPDNPEDIKKFFEAQKALGSSLSRLLVTAEAYPKLTATAGFRDLQSQLEGTENRIAVARRDYIDSIKAYNSNIRKFPGNFIASSFGFESVPQLEAKECVTAVPEIDFGGE